MFFYNSSDAAVAAARRESDPIIDNIANISVFFALTLSKLDAIHPLEAGVRKLKCHKS